jgi:hypothetical protein
MAFKFVQHKGPRMQKVFEKWDEILSWYEDKMNDFPYWYLERTNIGHLGLAVYQLNGIPTQEFSCQKGKGVKKSAGRADLHISMPRKGGTFIDFNIEAKQAWCSIRFDERSKPILRNALNEAISDCKNLKETAWKAQFRAGIVFLLPYSNAMPKDKTEIGRRLRAFTQSVSDECAREGVDFVTFHYPAMKTLMRISQQNAHHGWCPGIAVIGKLVP